MWIRRNCSCSGVSVKGLRLMNLPILGPASSLELQHEWQLGIFGNKKKTKILILKCAKH